jgi:uncharacterized protein YjbI with pentapeptide repeats
VRIQADAASLVLLARNDKADGARLVVTVGLLYGNDHQIVEMPLAQPWLQDRFGDEPVDRGLKKARGCFAVQGTAYPLTEGQARGMAVRVNVGQSSKTLHIHPPRRWEKTLMGHRSVVIGPLQPLPLNAANAFGGEGYASNPEGMGYRADPEAYDKVLLPAIETETQALTQPGGVPEWAGLMPLAPQSELRRRYLGTLDDQWQQQRAPFLPLDTDPRWYDEVAQDQCIDTYWSGTEKWAVAGMHPLRAEVSGQLPGFRPRLFVERKGITPPISEAALDLDTVWLFPDAQRVLLLYRAELSVVDIDAEDISALGIGCECATDGAQSIEQWVARLWPKPPVAAATAAPQVPQPDPLPTMVATMQAALDARYQAFAALQKEVSGAASVATKHFGQVVDTSIAERKAPDLAKVIANPKPQSAFDPAALRTNIELEIAQAKAAAQRYAEKAAHQAGTSMAAIEAHNAMLARSIAVKPAPSVMSLVGQLDIPANKKAQVVAELEAGLAKIQATESQVDSKISKIQAKLAAMSAAMPPVPKLSPAVSWTRALLEACHAAGETLDKQRFVSLDLSRIDLSAGVFKNCFFDRCNLSAARLAGADLSGCRFEDCDLTAADLKASALDKVIIQRCRLEQANAKGAGFSGAYLAQSSCIGIDFSEAQLKQSRFVECPLQEAKFNAAQLPLAVFTRCDLERADMSGANLNKSQFDQCTLHSARMLCAQLQGASWSRVEGGGIDLISAMLCDWRLDQDCRLPGIRLDGADLSNSSLQGAFLAGASLRNATLNAALVARCDLRDSDGYRLTARGADFTGSNLSRAKWVGSNLMDARLRKVCLEQTDLRGSNLFGASTEGISGRQVVLDDTVLNRCRLREDLARA